MALWKHHNTTRQIQYKEITSILGGGVYWVTTAVSGDAGVFFCTGMWKKMDQSRRRVYIYNNNCIHCNIILIVI